MNRKSSKDKERKSLLERDNYLCGIHSEGCGKKIESPDSDVCTIDHIVPKHLYRSLAPIVSPKNTKRFNKDYNGWWNKQPMHKECNEKRASGYNRQWPQYKCSCHFIHIEGNDAYIYGKEKKKGAKEWSWNKHLFLRNAVYYQKYPESSANFQGIFELHGQTETHWNYGIIHDKDKRCGYMFGSIYVNDVDKWNLRELSKVGLLSMSVATLSEMIIKENRKFKIKREQDNMGEVMINVEMEFPGIILNINIPILMILDLDDLVIWELQPFNDKHWSLVHPKPVWQIPKHEEILVRWAGCRCSRNDVLDRIDRWIRLYGHHDGWKYMGLISLCPQDTIYGW